MHGVKPYAVSHGLLQKPLILSCQPPSQSSALPQFSAEPSSSSDAMEIDDIQDLLDNDSDFNSDHDAAAEEMEGSIEMLIIDAQAPSEMAPLDGVDATNPSNSNPVSSVENSIAERQPQLSIPTCVVGFPLPFTLEYLTSST